MACENRMSVHRFASRPPRFCCGQAISRTEPPIPPPRNDIRSAHGWLISLRLSHNAPYSPLQSPCSATPSNLLLGIFPTLSPRKGCASQSRCAYLSRWRPSYAADRPTRPRPPTHLYRRPHRPPCPTTHEECPLKRTMLYHKVRAPRAQAGKRPAFSRIPPTASLNNQTSPT